MSEVKTIEKRTNKDILTEQLNRFKKEVIDYSLDLARHVEIKKRDPNFKKPIQGGGFQTIDELVERFQNGLENAQFYVATIEKMLEADEGGKLDDFVNGLKVSPVEAKPEGEAEGK